MNTYTSTGIQVKNYQYIGGFTYLNDTLQYAMIEGGRIKNIGLLENKKPGDRWLADQKYLGIKVRSAINPAEYNYLLNPIFPRFRELVKIVSVTEGLKDARL